MSSDTLPQETPIRGAERSEATRPTPETPASISPGHFAAARIRAYEDQSAGIMSAFSRGDLPGKSPGPLRTPSRGGGGDDAPKFHFNGPPDEAVREEFEKFWWNFRLPDPTSSSTGEEDEDEEEGGLGLHGSCESRLRRQLMSRSLHQSFEIDLGQVATISPSLVTWITRFPRVCMPIMDNFVNARKELIENQIEATERYPYLCRPFNPPIKSNMRDLNPSDIENLVCLKGIVIRCSDLIPEMGTAMFRCHGMAGTGTQRRLCGSRTMEPVNEDGQVLEPQSCTKCKKSHAFELDHQQCRFFDKQIIKLQETPETIPHGETPHTLLLHVFDDLFDYAKPGDRVEVTGTYRMQPVRTNPRKREVRSVNKTYIDVCHILKTSRTRSRLAETDPDDITGQASDERHVDLNDHQIQEVLQIAQEGNVYDRLAKSFAPSIWGNDDVKKGLLCQMFGGNSEVVTDRGRGSKQKRRRGRNEGEDDEGVEGEGEDGGNEEDSGEAASVAPTTKRGEIHVLLCGDPSTAKSQLLNYAYAVAPRGATATGRGTSAVGLTAYITKDPETKELLLESGALVLSDRGICCIDEFDKMDDNSRAILHETMEQQTVSVAKAGIICSLNARTAILACANPIASRYDPSRSVVQNINLSSTLMSRFDLIYLMLDMHTEEGDGRLAAHIIDLFCAPNEDEENGNKKDSRFIPRETFCNYITYAKALVTPRLTDEAAARLVEEWVGLRGTGGNVRRNVAATPRQLESLIRISEALAKIELSEIVEPRHVEEAVRLIRAALLKVAMDPQTGRIDMDALFTGHSYSQRNAIEKTERFASDILSNEGPMPFDSLLSKVNEQLLADSEGSPVTIDEFKDILHSMKNQGRISQRGDKFYILE